MEEREALAAQLAVIASPVRLAILDRLVRPAFAPELEDELAITRQSLKRHLDQLVRAELLETRVTKRGIFPATQYVASATGVFALKEAVNALATPPQGGTPNTVPSRAPGGGAPTSGPGLIVVHGRRAGEWFPFDGRRVHTVGRDEANDIALSWDPFVSSRHALLEPSDAGWTVRDLGARNGTLVDFASIPAGGSLAVGAGSILGIGRSLLVLRC